LVDGTGRAVIKFTFENIGANALFAEHHPANSASQRLLLKLSFRATHEDLYAPTGLNHPSYLLTSALHPSRSTPKKMQGPQVCKTKRSRCSVSANPFEA
jgi:hypothetical protein